MSMQWRGDDEIERNMEAFKSKVQRAIKLVAQYWQGVFERYAKQNAPWTDQTANARQSLHAWIKDVGGDEGVVELYLSHGMEYGIYLETRFSGRYAIIWPTIRAHLKAIGDMLKGIFK